MDRTPDVAGETPLTVEEYEAIHTAVLAGVGPRAGGQHWTLNSLLAAWSSVVEDLVDGYSDCAPEFVNDVWCRGALARVWRLLPSRVRVIRQRELDVLDGRFRAATVGRPDRDDESHQWWVHRIPQILEAVPGEPRWQGWPMGWDVMPFPKPDSVEVVE
ncbi:MULTISPECIES: hypothetical protein [Streptomyces]|uniref:DUF4913 domain-containing protein n=1 Tax=Streptomyces doebereineriae TaxID=3075528 RepID=A0ABU2VIH3_9ACTN|nr:hypothetical protein [Streptomyces sp. DSM 41640]MDT0485381.1 hypothetical protein [Streptomyces sp. DSM 41640]